MIWGFLKKQLRPFVSGVVIVRILLSVGDKSRLLLNSHSRFYRIMQEVPIRVVCVRDSMPILSGLCVSVLGFGMEGCRISGFGVKLFWGSGSKALRISGCSKVDCRIGELPSSNKGCS